MKKNIKSLSLSILICLSLYACPTTTVVNPTTSSPSDASADIGAATNKEQQTNATLAPNYPAPSASVAATSAPTTSPTTNASAVPMASATSVPSGSASIASGIAPVVAPSPVEEPKTKDNLFKDYGINPFISTKEDTLSTFGLDVDTASYTWMRKSILNNLMVTKDSVRTEEYINYFDYNYAKPEASNKFSINTELTKVKNSNVLRVGLKALEIDNSQRKNAHLTLVIDISGSMDQENRLNLVKESTKLLVKSLTANDYISIVVFGNNARTVINHSNNKEQITSAIDSLTTEGATNTEAGLNLGYSLAKEHYKTGYINKVILCSDGFANVGATSPDVLLNKIKQDALSGISLSTIGFGMGNYNDVLMEQLADKGDGSYSYVDDLKEANRIFIENITGTLQTVAKDAKVQISFNPDVVTDYRLIGYENRDIADNDFRNDKVDSGDVGSGQTVTALYELRFKENADTNKNIGTIFLRYKDVDQNLAVKELNKDIKLSELKSFEGSDNSTKTAVAAAAYAEILRGAYWSQSFSFDDVKEYANNAYRSNNNDKLKDFISIVEKAKTLK